jgi:hypothetical protein
MIADGRVGCKEATRALLREDSTQTTAEVIRFALKNDMAGCVGFFLHEFHTFNDRHSAISPRP